MTAETGVTRRGLLQFAGAAGAGLALSGIAAGAATGAERGDGQVAGRLLVRNATLLTMDPRLGDLASSDVLIDNGVIAAVGPSLAVDAGRTIEAQGMLMLPGLVDAHWHLWNSILRNAAPTERGQTFFNTLKTLSARFTPELAYTGVRLGLAEAINAGITTVNDWAHNIRGPAFADAELRALAESGLRARLWYGYPQDMPATSRMDFTDIQRLQAQLSASSRIDLGIAIRGPERTEPAIWEQEFAFANRHGLPLSTHISVTRAAQAKNAVRQLAERKLLNPKVQLVHATHVSEEDIHAIAASGASVTLTPVTEMRVGYGLAQVMALHNAGIPLSLGMDTLVLAGNANPFAVMQTTLNLANATAENELALSPRQVLHWATQGGADAMGLGAVTGSITPGKRADLLLIDTRRLGLTPLTDAPATVVQAATPVDVHTVIASGRLLKHEGRLTGMDTQALMKEAQASWNALKART